METLCCFVTLACATLHAAEPVTVTVHDSYRDINGTTEVPAGLFGTHAVPLTPERVKNWNINGNRFITHGPNGKPVPLGSKKAPAGIEVLVECYYDRFQPALTVTKPKKYEQFLIGLGQKYGSNAANSGQQHYLEFWNEPYLNWATKPGVNYDPRYYENKGIKEGDPVYLRGATEPTQMKWKKGRWYEALTRIGDVGGTYSTIGVGPLYRKLLAAKAGDELSWGGRKIKAIDTLVPYDPGQVSWWSGPQNVAWYNSMITALGEGLKQTNKGNVHLLAGWGFHIHQDWPKAWEIVHKPTIDASINLIHGYHEHHYGGDTREVAADYEMVTAYTDVNYDKRLLFFNTECGANYDSQRPDKYKTNLEHWYEETYADEKERRLRIAFSYMIRDIVHLIDMCPDKGVFRVSHHAHQNGGTPKAFTFMNQLRGKMLAAESSDAEVWVVASNPSGNKATITVFNNAREPRQVTLKLPAGAKNISRVDPQYSANEILLKTVAEGLTVKVEAQSASVWHLDMAALPSKTTSINQYFADAIRMQVNKEAISCKVNCSAKTLTSSTAAVLKIAQTGATRIRYRLNGVEAEAAVLPFTNRIPVDKALIKETNKLEFLPGDKAYEVRMASLELISK